MSHTPAPKNVVHTNGIWQVIRKESFGFGCNSKSASWEVHRNGQFFSSAMRLRDAKDIVATLAKVGAA